MRPKARECRDFLAAHRDRVIGKDELMEALWPDRVVTEQSLFQCIGEVRAHCGKAAIETHPGRGYRWRGQPTRQPALRVAAAVAILAGFAALLALPLAIGDREPALTSPVIALLPAAATEAPVEAAISAWLSVYLPATLVTGADAVAASSSGDADVLVRIGRITSPGDGEKSFRVGYRIESRNAVFDGEVTGSDANAIAESFGSTIRETLLRDQFLSPGAAPALFASHRAGLAHWMAGDIDRALVHGRSLAASSPDFLPAQSLMTGLEIDKGLLKAARARADRMLGKGRARGDDRWTLAGQLALADVFIATGDLARARSMAAAAIETARVNGDHRKAGKAAERLADIAERESATARAVDWLVAADGYYSEGRCTVGAARVERKLRALVNGPDLRG